MNDEEKKEEGIFVIIPPCCREGWDDCPHVPQQEQRKRRNIGI